jgi:hypothetical protein
MLLLVSALYRQVERKILRNCSERSGASSPVSDRVIEKRICSSDVGYLDTDAVSV